MTTDLMGLGSSRFHFVFSVTTSWKFRDTIITIKRTVEGFLDAGITALKNFSQFRKSKSRSSGPDVDRGRKKGALNWICVVAGISQQPAVAVAATAITGVQTLSDCEFFWQPQHFCCSRTTN